MQLFPRLPSQVLVGLVVASGLFLPSAALSQPPAPSTFDFTKHIKPIFESKCYSCHSSTTLQGGGVNLNERGGATTGGYSQRPLLGGTLETNEIYRRVTSKDPAYRMPKGQPPLSPDEVARIRRWVEVGTPWPADEPPDTERHKWFDREAWTYYGERWLNEVPGFVAWLCALLVIQFTMLFVERYKRAVKEQRAWTASPRTRWLSPLKSIGVSHYLLVATVMCLALSMQVISGMKLQMQKLDAHLAAVRSAGPVVGQPNTLTVYGNPPQPIRPTHPRRLSGTYYRGNCERSAELFNGGNYRTATLRIALVDRQGRERNYGDRVSPDNLAVRFELERAQGTTEQLFGDSISKGVFLSTQPLTDMFTPLKSPVERVRIVKPDWKWEATYPIDAARQDPNQTLSGLIYVYQGTVQDGQARGTFHFGIQYRIQLKDQVLQPESELWMGSLFWSPALEHPNQGKIPMKQWFDDEPIPEITGKNSTDPKLLGIPEHQRKKESQGK